MNENAARLLAACSATFVILVKERRDIGQLERNVANLQIASMIQMMNELCDEYGLPHVWNDEQQKGILSN